jgi:hypothetical protein
MPQPLTLADGDYEFAELIRGWLVHPVDAIPPQVELIASSQDVVGGPVFLSPAQTATTVAIRMDAQVAIDLDRRLREIIRRMGWPLPP